MLKRFDRKLIFEDGSEYFGYAFGDTETKVCEIVFNTAMVGYQEILSDPSYTYQAVVMTYPLIGNYGMAEEDYETDVPTIGALIVGAYNDVPSHYRSAKTLGEVMKEYHIPGIYGVDTRKLTRYIRDCGSKKVLLTDSGTTPEEGLRVLARTDIPANAVSVVSKREICRTTAPQTEYHVVAIDCGMKRNIVRSLHNRQCALTTVPYDTSAEYIEACKPDGILISNGPGDPRDVPEVIHTVRRLRGKFPIFGICLGHQIICLAYGAACYKLKFGHRGANHPVQNIQTGKIEITSQNHSYAIDPESLEKTPLTVTHINLLDHTVEGAKCDKDRVFSVQYHPESAPGPEDSAYLFDRFVEMMREGKYAEKN